MWAGRARPPRPCRAFPGRPRRSLRHSPLATPSLRGRPDAGLRWQTSHTWAVNFRDMWRGSPVVSSTSGSLLPASKRGCLAALNLRGSAWSRPKPAVDVDVAVLPDLPADRPGGGQPYAHVIRPQQKLRGGRQGRVAWRTRRHRRRSYRCGAGRRGGLALLLRRPFWVAANGQLTAQQLRGSVNAGTVRSVRPSGVGVVVSLRSVALHVFR